MIERLGQVSREILYNALGSPHTSAPTGTQMLRNSKIQNRYPSLDAFLLHQCFYEPTHIFDFVVLDDDESFQNDLLMHESIHIGNDWRPMAGSAAREPSLTMSICKRRG